MLGDLAIRLASAILLGVPFVLSIYAGAPFFDLWIIAGILFLSWEWYRLIAGADGTFGVRGVAFVLCASIPVLVAALVSPEVALAVIAAAALAMVVPRAETGWLTGGLVYLTLPCVALIWLRHDGFDGRATVFWLVAVVWSADVGAYFAGRLLGGPKLAPTISPNKTWAGFAGAAAGALAAGVLTSLLAGGERLMLLSLLSVVLGLFAQGGDLLESWLKRRFGAKDSSGLIPGHGGLLDRVDGLMAAALLLALIDLFTKGSMTTWL